MFAKTRSGRAVRVAAITFIIASAVALYARGVPNNPPGFYIDESSIAYNAYLISQTARDEYGVQWPLYFLAFGEYKNPIYIYLLTAIFRVTGPSVLAARMLSALLGAAAALLLGLLAWRLSRQFWLAVVLTSSALLTPWLYESSRLVFEVAAYALVITLFLLVLQRAAARKRWQRSDVIAVAITLALLTYTYSIGRLLGPLLAAGLIFFAHKHNRRALALTLVAYVITQLRLIVFPVLLHVLIVPGLQFLSGAWRSDRIFARWSPVTFVVILILTQGAYFQWLFQRQSPARWYVMDARFPRKILEPALATNRRPIYLSDPINHSGYIQALWHASLRGLPSSDLVRTSDPDSVPAGSVIISSEQDCEKCRLIARSLNYIVYTTLPSDLFPNAGPLPAEAFHAEVSLRQEAAVFQAGHVTILRTSVRNISSAAWSCTGDDSGRYTTDVHARWRDQNGKLISEGGRAYFNYDLEPRDVNDVDLPVAGPAAPGTYLLEIDVMQEPDEWFGAKGSKPLVLHAMVGP